MKALSLQAPWWWYVLWAKKRVENRVGFRWAEERFRGSFLIHASKWFQEDDIAMLVQSVKDEFGGAIPFDPKTPSFKVRDFKRVRGGIVGRATLVDIVPATVSGHRWRRQHDAVPCELCGLPRPPMQDWIAAFKLGHREPVVAECPSADRWAERGRVQRDPPELWLLLDQVKPLPFVPWKGDRGFFDIDAVAYALLAVAHDDGGPLHISNMVERAREICPAVDRRAEAVLPKLVEEQRLNRVGDVYCAVHDARP